MNKRSIIAISIVATLTLMSGCASSNNANTHEQKHQSSHKNISQKEMQKLIIKAGESKDWIMTEYKRDTVLAEKINDNNGISVEVKFNKGSFHIVTEDDVDFDDLQDAIEDALEKE